MTLAPTSPKSATTTWSKKLCDARDSMPPREGVGSTTMSKLRPPLGDGESRNDDRGTP